MFSGTFYASNPVNLVNLRGFAPSRRPARALRALTFSNNLVNLLKNRVYRARGGKPCQKCTDFTRNVPKMHPFSAHFCCFPCREACPHAGVLIWQFSKFAKFARNEHPRHPSWPDVWTPAKQTVPGLGTRFATLTGF